jgi:hypothetical protein
MVPPRRHFAASMAPQRLFSALALLCALCAANRTFIVSNECDIPIWVAGIGSPSFNPGVYPLWWRPDGFLAPGQTATVRHARAAAPPRRAAPRPSRSHHLACAYADRRAAWALIGVREESRGNVWSLAVGRARAL